MVQVDWVDDYLEVWGWITCSDRCFVCLRDMTFPTYNHVAKIHYTLYAHIQTYIMSS